MNSRRAAPVTTVPGKTLLLRLRGFVEMLVPFDKARQSLGIDDATHRRWLREGKKLLGPDDQSDEAVAEYARVAETARASQVTTLTTLRGKIARDPKHPQQLKAIEGTLEWFDRNPEEKAEEGSSGLGFSPAEIACLPPADQAELKDIASQARALANRARAVVERNRSPRVAQVSDPARPQPGAS